MNRNLDQIFRDKLYSRPVKAPDSSWDVIEAAINGEQKKRGLAWFIVPAMLLTLLLATAGMWWSDQSAEGQSIDVLAQPDQKPADPNTADAAYVENENQPSQTADIVIKENASIIDNDDSISRKAVKEITPKPSQKTYTKSNTPSARKSSSTDTNVRNERAIKELDMKAAIDKSTPQASIEINRLKPLSDESKTTPAEFRDELKNIGAEHTSKTHDITALLALNDIKAFDIAPIQLSNRIINRMEDPCLFGKGKECYDFKNKAQPTAVYGELLVGPDVVNRSLRSSGNGPEQALTLRKESEQMELSWSAALRGSVVTSNGIAFRAGLLYSRIHERFNHQGRETRTRQIVIGGVTTTVVETGTVTRTIYNTLRTIDLPILLGYEVDMGNYILALNGGGALNLSFSQEGQILASTDNPVSINPSDPNSVDIFKDNAGVSLLGSVGLYYKLSDQMQLMVEPNVRYRLGSVTRDSYGIEQKYLTIGVQAGVRFRLK